MDNGTISSWASSVVCAALPGGVRDRLFARRFSGGYKGGFRNRISSLGVLAWRGIGIARGWYAWFAGEVFHRCFRDYVSYGGSDMSEMELVGHTGNCYKADSVRTLHLATVRNLAGVHKLEALYVRYTVVEM